MSEKNEFTELLQQVEAGDSDAAKELLHRYEPHVRRVVRSRLRDPRLRRTLDTVDISQTVLKSFFHRAALGQYEIQTPDDLLKLLATMVRNKIVSRNRHEQAECRDQNRLAADHVGDLPVADPGPSPSQIVSEKELHEEALRRLSPEELELRALREEGLEWNEIAQRLGSSAEALRKQWSRAVDRVLEELGLEE